MPILDPEIETVRVILPRPQVIRLSDTEIAPGNFGGEFIDLTDVPNSYAGASLKIVRVNAGETGLEFADASGSFLSANIARVDPSGDDGTGMVGDLNKPFLTVQAAIDEIVAENLIHGVVDVGANQFSEDLILGDPVAIRFVGISAANNGPVSAASQAFSSLTITAVTGIEIAHCFTGDIFTSQDLELILNDSWTGDIISTQTGGSLIVRSVNNNGQSSSIHGGDVATLQVFGMRPGGTGNDSIDLSAGNTGTITLINCTQQSGYTGAYDVSAIAGSVSVTNSILNSLTSTDAMLIDSRVIGTITTGNAAVYQNVLLVGPIQPTPTTLNEVIALLQTAGLCS